MIGEKTKRVLEVIKQTPAISNPEIAHIMEMPIFLVNYHVRMLRKEKLVHISGWVNNSRNVPTILLSIGFGIDVERPPLRKETIKRLERKIEVKEKFVAKPDMAAAWLYHPVEPQGKLCEETTEIRSC